MGMFLSLSGVIGRSENQVADALKKYAVSVDGSLEKLKLHAGKENCCVLSELNGNTSIAYPNDYLEWDDSSAFISRELQAPVFSFHIHDGDLWMYVLYADGLAVDRFNPIPDYWEEIGEEEKTSWKGEAGTIIKYVNQVKKEDIEKYLTFWNTDPEEQQKAYPDDKYGNEDWQLLDFMRKLGLPYPFDDDVEPAGTTYQLWTKTLPLQQHSAEDTLNSDGQTKKPWWKFW